MLDPQLLQNLALPSIFKPHSEQNFIISPSLYGEGELVGDGSGLGTGEVDGSGVGDTAGDTAGIGFAVVNPSGHFGCTAITDLFFSPVLL